MMSTRHNNQVNVRVFIGTASMRANTACTGRLGLGAFFGVGSELEQFPVSERFLPSRR
jgi:hypothetical protein